MGLHFAGGQGFTYETIIILKNTNVMIYDISYMQVSRHLLILDCLGCGV